jgi:sarcosine oxidase subunit alpha
VSDGGPDDDARALPPGEPRRRAIAIDFEGRTVRAFEGEPVAAALWAAGVRVLGRSPKYHRPRGLFCAEGHCASCLMRIDGRPNRRACLVPATDGLRCERQNAFPDADVDLLRAADWLFPRGMDHHRMLTGTRLGNELFLKLVRQMGGSGTLPDAPAERVPVRREDVDACIVGGGPAGLTAAAAVAAARPGARVLVFDEQDAPGGSLLAEPDGVARGRALAEAARARGARLLMRATAIAYYAEDGDAPADHDGPAGVLAVATEDGLVRVTARRYLYATGAYDQNLPLPDGDRAGVLSARACGRLAFRWGVRPGARVILVEDPEQPFAYAERLARGLEARGVPVARTSPDGLDDARPSYRDDVVAVAALPAPASELPRQHGARVRLDPARGGFVVEGPETGVANVLAAGDLAGYVGPDEAARAGDATGRLLAERL